MRALVCLIRKELMESFRTGKMIIVLGIFILFGIMNPAFAKLTPFIMEKFAETDESMGIVITGMTMDAGMSWQQFYKNMPMLVVAFLLIYSGIFTNEFQKNTLIPIVTKGLERWKIVVSKTIVLLLVWTVGYCFNYGLTYFYTDYYWDNGIMSNLFLGGFCYWLFGTVIIALVVFFSSISKSSGEVLLGVGVVYFVVSILSMVKAIGKVLPTALCSQNIIYGSGTSGIYMIIWESIVAVALLLIMSISLFNRRSL